MKALLLSFVMLTVTLQSLMMLTASILSLIILSFITLHFNVLSIAILNLTHHVKCLYADMLADSYADFNIPRVSLQSVSFC